MRTYPEPDYVVIPVLKRDQAILLALRTCLQSFSLHIKVSDIYKAFDCPDLNNQSRRSLNQAITSILTKLFSNADPLFQRLFDKGTMRWNSHFRGTDGSATLDLDNEGAMNLFRVVQIWLIRMREASKTDCPSQHRDNIVKLWRPSRSARKFSS